MRGSEYLSFVITNQNEIYDFILGVSESMADYIKNHNSSFVLFYKYLTHSDLPTFGKATKTDSHDNNFLYYIKSSEMIEIEKKSGKPFQTTHQSNIGLSNQFYDETGLPNPRSVGNSSHEYHLNDYCNVYVWNENMKYFTFDYTSKVFDALGKDWRSKNTWNKGGHDLSLDSNKPCTQIDLHCAVHGIGMRKDEDFHNIRHHLFKNDTFIILYEKKQDKDNMFLLFEKNPAFFSLIGETNKAYENYQKKLRSNLISNLTLKTNVIDDKELEIEISRRQQNAWRNMLAREIMSYSNIEGDVFCPFTYIQCSFEDLGTLFVASHIKGFSDENTTNEEKYDINNGLLLSSNADALFDKHLISVNKDKELVFSFFLNSDTKLKQQLLLMQPIFTPLLNENRMQYLAYHYEKFLECEEERKSKQ